MDQILEQSSEAEYNQDPQSNRTSQFNALSKRSKDGSFVNLENKKDYELNLQKQKWESQLQNQIKINCKFSDEDEFNSSGKKHNEVNMSEDSLDYEHQKFQKDNYKINNYKFQKENSEQKKLNFTSDFDDLSEDAQIPKIKRSLKQQQNQIESQNLSFSCDSDNQNIIEQQRQGSKRGYLISKNNQYDKKLHEIKQEITNAQAQTYQEAINPLAQNKIFDKTVSDYEFEDSVQDLKKDTFYRIRDDLIKQLDQEREKNRLMEQKIMSRDKSFFEIKSQFNELLLNYESKQKECEILKKNQNQLNSQNLNQSHQSISSLKTNKKNFPTTERSNPENANSIEKKYNKLLSKYKNDSEFDDSDFENNDNSLNGQNEMTQKKSSEISQKYKISQQNFSENRFRKNSQQDSLNDETQQNRLNGENQLLEMKIQRQRDEIAKLTKLLDDEKYNKLKMTQKIADLESQIQTVSHQKDEKDKTSILQLQQNNSLLMKQIEEQTENQKLLQLEVKEIKELLKKKDQKINELQNDDKDNQSLLAKAEKLLKQYENLKEEYCLKCKELEQVIQENQQLKESKQEYKLKDFIDQQDKLIQRLNAELENQKQDYQVQIDQATRNLLDLIQRLFGEKGEFYCLPQNSCLWISQIFGKENSQNIQQNQYDQDKSEFQESINLQTILQEIEQLQKDYCRYKDFAKVFKDMIKSIAKSELNQQPTLKDCWKYFKWLYNQYIKLKLEDQMNQSTTNILLKMLKLSNEHEIILAVQNLITQNDRLQHMQQLIASQNSNQFQQNNQHVSSFNYSNIAKQENSNSNSNQMQNDQNQLRPFNYGKENKSQCQQKIIENQKRSRSPAATSLQNTYKRNINNNSFQNQAQQNNNYIKIDSQKQQPKLNNNKFSQQEQKQFQNRTQNNDISQNYYQSLNTQFDTQSSVGQKYYYQAENKTEESCNQFQNRFQRGNLSNNRSLPRLQSNYFD
ncbi:hypothetical protein TTHERM_00196120 (macronuclear) [Tetrahymena thermophila SB210]|uniref:Uncharacterized protein n=1 Tax=Tetrahymena thermophila (strain SB210) TaxID=312017 RepID=Q23K22_TETTS|nr:hypothetical protein TTHERM_00196120 [Tetrahymena thermophila SB210]EAR97021.1 hypothetical protein TTHERM_00196120 [Tetrahymena thermophila SB210]|eukprot:XP_001017266.1 hypothetical protein TTHERM_00196120 [Tetrahymena thermophila SB210]